LSWAQSDALIVPNYFFGTLTAKRSVLMKINSPPAAPTKAAKNSALRVGFVPLTDCAPLVMAQELGLYKKYGLNVQLSRELGWATIRDKIIHKELDAAHAPAAMPVAASLGLGAIPCECLTALVLNLNGNAITLSTDLWARGVRDGKTLREEIIRSRREKTYTFGAVFPFSSHRHLLRRWFSAHGIDPDRDVRIVIVPPPQMVANLKTGNLDGFCVGEPWNSVAVQAHVGWIAATSSQLDALHPEKVLMVRADFAAQRSAEHVALVAALIEACEFCDAPENHEQIIEVLARPQYVGVAADSLRHGIDGAMDFGHAAEHAVRDFCIFHRDHANEPSGDKAAWVLDLIRASGLCAQPAALNFAFAKKIFRADIFEAASRLRLSTNTNPASRAGRKGRKADISQDESFAALATCA
jgi:ABC-type nitrate/sulfonate/bicarbonate transport system substrate-binding protein